MKLRAALYLVIGLTSVAPILAQAMAEPIPVLTVCEALRDLKTYNGKDVLIVGRSAWTFEGTFLSENCEQDGHILLQGSRWLSAIYLSGDSHSSGRQTGVNEELLRQKLAEVKRTTRLTSEQKPTSRSNQFADHWTAVRGRLVSPPTLIPPRPANDSQPQSQNTPGNGFGANGSVPAKLIQRVTFDL